MFQAAGQLDNVPYRLEWPQFAGGAPIIEAMNADAVDIGAMSDAPFIFGFASGAPVKALLAVRGRPDSVSMLVANASPYHLLIDLKGKRVAAVRGSIAHYLILASLQQAGLPLDSIDIAYLNAGDAKAALASGAIDGWCTWEPYLSIGAESDNLRGLPRDDGIDTSIVFLVASDRALKEKRDMLADFVQRLTRAYGWAAKNPDAYAKLYAEGTGLSVTAAAAVTRRQFFAFSPIDAAVLQQESRLIAVFQAAHLLRAGVDFGGAYENGFSTAMH